MTNTDRYKLKVSSLPLTLNLIKRMNSIYPEAKVDDYGTLLGTEDLNEDLIKYALENNHQDVCKDSCDPGATNHQLADDLNNLRLSLDK